MSLTAGALLPRFLEPDCARCSEPLPEPGQQCPGCGAVPGHTRAEVEERLAVPGTIAKIEAADLRRAAWQLVGQTRGLLRAADMAEHVAELERRRDEIAGLLPAARAAVATCSKKLKAAQRAEREAQDAVKDSLANYNACADAWEAAVRTRASATVRTDALLRKNAAGPVLEADQAALDAAVRDREAAERELGKDDGTTGARRIAGDLEDKLAAAEHAVKNPGRPAKSAITLGLDLSRQAVMLALGLSRQVPDSDLTEDEEAQVRSLGAAVAGLSGASEMIAGLAVETHEKAKASEYRDQAAYLRPIGPGNLEAVANPALAGRP
jgi:hypothetical protein